jgi:hypothetical protein
MEQDTKHHLPELQKVYDELKIPFRFASSFGEVSFTIANSIVDSEPFRNMSAEAILQYRDKNQDARKQYISKNLADLANMTIENPWSKTAEFEVHKYVTGKLAGDIVAYDMECRDTWRKLRGSIPTHIAEVTSKSVIGGVAGGVLGTVTATHGWPVLLAGALVGAVAQGPKVVKDITDAMLELERIRRSPIAYLSELNRPRRSRVLRRR